MTVTGGSSEHSEPQGCRPADETGPQLATITQKKPHREAKTKPSPDNKSARMKRSCSLKMWEKRSLTCWSKSGPGRLRCPAQRSPPSTPQRCTWSSGTLLRSSPVHFHLFLILELINGRSISILVYLFHLGEMTNFVSLRWARTEKDLLQNKLCNEAS